MSFEDDVRRFTEGPLRCDFCNREMGALEPKRVYQAHAQNLLAVMRSGLEIADDGEWAACEDCAKLIDAKDWDALKEFCLAGAIAEHPEEDVEAMRLKLGVILHLVFGVPSRYDGFLDLRQ